MKYLVVFASEHGICLDMSNEVNFVDKDKSIELFDEYLEEYGYACIFEISEKGLKCIRKESL